MNRAWPLPALETASDGRDSDSNGQQRKKTCKPDIGEDTFTRRRELIHLIYLLLTFVLVDTFLSYSLAKHGKGEPFLSPPSRPVRLEGSDSERLCTLRPRFLAAAASEQ